MSRLFTPSAQWSHIYKCFTKQKHGGLFTLEWILDCSFQDTLWECESYTIKSYFVMQAMCEHPIILKAYSMNDPKDVIVSPVIIRNEQQRDVHSEQGVEI